MGLTGRIPRHSFGMIHHHQFSISTRGKGTYEITHEVELAMLACGLREGLVNVFVRHTSCSLCLMENADPSARQDLHEFFERLVSEKSPFFVHTAEGPDDMPSHIRSVLTTSSHTIPISEARLLLGTWQGIFLFEHRKAPHHRQIVLTFMGE